MLWLRWLLMTAHGASAHAATHLRLSRRTPAETAAKFPPVLGGQWSSGLPFLNAALKEKHPSQAGIQLDLADVDSAPLKVSCPA